MRRGNNVATTRVVPVWLRLVGEGRLDGKSLLVLTTGASRFYIAMKSELETFDGLDNRREIIILLERLGTDARRARFIESLIPRSMKGFADAPMKVQGNCDAIAAYYMLVGVTNELGVSINEAAKLLDNEVRRL